MSRDIGDPTPQPYADLVQMRTNAETLASGGILMTHRQEATASWITFATLRVQLQITTSGFVSEEAWDGPVSLEIDGHDWGSGWTLDMLRYAAKDYDAAPEPWRTWLEDLTRLIADPRVLGAMVEVGAA